MKYKCDNCGYRFKSDSETICPECLTARSEESSNEDASGFSSDNQYQPNYRGYNQNGGADSGNGMNLHKSIKIVMVIIAIAAIGVTLIPFIAFRNNMSRATPEPELIPVYSETPANDSYENNEYDDDYEDPPEGDYDYEFSTYEQSFKYGENCKTAGLEVSFSAPREYTGYSELYTLPEETGMKVLAVDVRIQNNKPEEYESYEYFAAYSTALQDMDLAVDGAYEVDYTWSAISFNGLMENQIPDSIEVFRGSDLEYTMYFLVSQECENPRLIFTDYTFINNEMTETHFIFS